MVDLLLVVPHPDDEVFSCGGMFCRMHRFGKRVATLTLTRGGAGRTLDLCGRPQLPEVRERELRASLDTLGVADVFIFDYPDYVPDPHRGMPERPGLAGIDERELCGRIASVLEELRPRALLTFGPNGSNGHPDHVVTHAVVRKALEATGQSPSLYFFASEYPYAGEPRPGFLSPEEIRRLQLFPTHVVEVGEFVESKLRAMAQHQTQALSVLNFLRYFPRRVLVETFHKAGPPLQAGEGARTVPWLE